MKIYKENYGEKNHNFKKIKYKIDNNECWVCVSHSKDSDGYPTAHRNGKLYGVHRYIYICEYGEIEEGKFVLHNCDNRECINLQHLYIGDHKQNMKDMAKRNQNLHKSKQGTNNPQSKLSKKQVIEIKNKLNNTSKSYKEIGDEYGISFGHVGGIARGEKWSHINY